MPPLVEGVNKGMEDRSICMESDCLMQSLGKGRRSGNSSRPSSWAAGPDQGQPADPAPSPRTPATGPEWQASGVWLPGGQGHTQCAWCSLDLPSFQSLQPSIIIN